MNDGKRASRHLDLDEHARQLLMDLADGGDGTAMSVMIGHAIIKSRLLKLAHAIWTQGWDCREEQGPLAGAFGHANRYNPYRQTRQQSKCRRCGISPLRTERGRCEDCGDCQGCGDDDCPACESTDTIKGSEGIPAPVDAVLFPGKETPPEELAVAVGKLRGAPVPNLEERVTFEPPAAAAWDAGYEAGLLAQSQKSRGRPKFKIFNPYRKR